MNSYYYYTYKSYFDIIKYKLAHFLNDTPIEDMNITKN